MAKFFVFILLTFDFVQAVKDSNVIEVIDSKVRCKENPEKWVIEGSHPDVPLSPRGVHSPTREITSDTHFPTSHNTRVKSADDAVQYIPAEELDEEVVAHSEMWKWVDAPVFVPRKPAASSATQSEQSEFLSMH